MKRRPYLAMLASVLMGLMAVACGVPVDSAPIAVENGSLPTELQLGRLPTPVPTPSEFNFQIFMAGGDDRLQVVGRNVSGLTATEATVEETAANATAIVNSLLLGTTPDEAAQGIHSALNWRTELSDLEVADVGPVGGTKRVATVTLTPQSLQGVVGSDLKLALAQIVFSITHRQSIDGVSFAIGNAPLAVPTDSGIAARGAPVTRDDFASLDPLARVRPEFDQAVSATAEPGRIPLVDVQIWLIDSQNRLAPVTRRLARSAVEMIDSLRVTPPQVELDRGLRTAVGPGIIDVLIESNEQSSDFGTAFVTVDDLSLPGYDYEERLLAAAQIVFTLSGLVEVDNVVFIQAGTKIAVPTSNGLSLIPESGQAGLRREDYAPLSPDPLPTPTPSPTTTPSPSPTP